MLLCAAPLQRSTDSETAPFQDFLQGSHHAARLMEPNVERPECGAGADNRRPLALHQSDGNTAFVFVHHSVDEAVKENFQFARDVAPIAGRADDEVLTSPQFLQHLHGIVLGQTARVLTAAVHTARAVSHSEVGRSDEMHLFARFLQRALHFSQHLRDESFATRARIDDEYPPLDGFRGGRGAMVIL